MNQDNRQKSEDSATRNTLMASYCPAPIQEARAKQDALLLERFRGQRYKIADIGCGDGYHGALFAPGCELYHGFEIAPEIAELAAEKWRAANLTNTRLFIGDVADMSLERDFYDLAFCLYFTPGNFREKSEDLSLYTDAYLDRNPAFIDMVSRFYDALKPGGSFFLTVYKDVPEAEAAQIDFYEHTGQHVVSPRGSRFVATAEQFWSARWTERSMLTNLEASGIASGSVSFHDLNHIAWLVEIQK